MPEICFSWEELYADRTNTVTDGVYTQPQDNFDVSRADPDLGDLVEHDHNRPPAGSYVFGPAYDGTCFAISGNLLYYCKPKQPEYWPGLYYIEVSPPQFPGMLGLFHNGQTYFITTNEIYYIQGTGHGTFLPLPMKAKCGSQSKRGAVSVHGKGIFHIGPDGIYLFGSGQDVKVTEENLEPIFRGEAAHGLPAISTLSNAFLHVYGNRLYFGYTGAGDTYPANILVFNLDSERLAYYTYNDGAVVYTRSIATDHTNKRLLIGDSTGYVRVIESPSYTADSGAAISYEVQTKDYELQTRKHFPRWCKYDVTVNEGSTCTGALLLDGSVHQSHTITGTRDTRRRLTNVGNGNKVAIKISGTGPVTIYAAESE